MLGQALLPGSGDARDGDGGKPRGDLQKWLRDRRNRRAIPHRFESCGYVPVRNSAREDGLWLIAGTRQVVYGRQEIAPGERFASANSLKAEEDRKAAELAEKFKAAIERQ